MREGESKRVRVRVKWRGRGRGGGCKRGRGDNKYYVTYKPITILCILFMFIKIKFIYCHSSVMFAMKLMSMCND